ILIFFIAEIFGDRQTGQSHAQARAGWFVHLTVHQSDFGIPELVLLDHARFGHFMVQVVAFTRALTHPREDGDTAVELGDVVNELHDNYCFAHASAAEGADLAAFKEWTYQIDHLDPRWKDLRRSGLIFER